MIANIDNSKGAVKLRTKQLTDGSESLYLDIYIDGKRKYEYLKLYLLPGKNNAKKNKETLAIANAVKAQRIVDIQNGRFGFEKKECNYTLVGWMEHVKEQNIKKNKSSNYTKIAGCAIKHVREFIKDKPVKLKDVDRKFVISYIAYLRRVKVKDRLITEQTVYLYYMALNIALNVAVVEGVLVKNPCKELASDDKPKQKQTEREYLTLEEVKKFIDTPCRPKEVVAKNMFLFACFTGLRFIDIKNLKWKNIVKIDNKTYQIQINQQKTKNLVTVPLTDNALKWLPDADGADKEDIVFSIDNYFNVNQRAKRIAQRAGIDKKITFHVSRHTYATLLLYYGADLYTVSKLLGHTNVKTTQIYAKVMDESKRKAVNLIPEV